MSGLPGACVLHQEGLMRLCACPPALSTAERLRRTFCCGKRSANEPALLNALVRVSLIQLLACGLLGGVFGAIVADKDVIVLDGNLDADSLFARSFAILLANPRIELLFGEHGVVMNLSCSQPRGYQPIPLRFLRGS